MDPSQIVRSGYNANANEYLQSRLSGAPGLPLVDELIDLVPLGSIVVDAGCGAGVPLTPRLARHYRVLGLDFSLSQLRLAIRLVPDVLFACQDLTALGLAPSSIDAVCSFYAIIHVPRNKHRAILQDVHRILRPGGYALLCLGAEDLFEEFADYQGSPMYWSHFDAATYLQMLADVGLPPIRHALVPDPIDQTGAHLFVLARKPGG
jgi:SAM-dependent methyltransferase